MTTLADIKASRILRDALVMSTADYKMLSNDLRIKVLDGYNPSAAEMLTLVNDIRQGRRNAARAMTAGSSPARGRRKTTTEVPMTKENLQAILDDEA